jgi:ABC-2 type transport system permease protein
LLREAGLIFLREMSHRMRYPVFVVLGLVQPLLYLFFFGPLLTKFVTYTPGFPPGTTWFIFAPSLMLQMVLIGSTMVGSSFLAEYRSGVFERFRVTPIGPYSLLLGKVAAVVTIVLVQSIVIVLLCHVVFDVDPPWYGLALCLVLVGLLSAALASLSYAVALRVKNEEGVGALLNSLLLPMLLLSGTLITAGLAPAWLYRLSRLNPVSYVMEAARAAFRGDLGAGSLQVGSLVLVLMTALAVFYAARVFRREGA